MHLCRRSAKLQCRKGRMAGSPACLVYKHRGGQHQCPPQELHADWHTDASWDMLTHSLAGAGTEAAKNVNKNNAQHCIVFEAVALALALEADQDLLVSAVSLLGKFISVREPNIKYLGLENLVRLAEVPAVADALARCGPVPQG